MAGGVIHTPTESLQFKRVGKWFCFSFKDQVDAIIMDCEKDDDPMEVDTDRIADIVGKYEEGRKRNWEEKKDKEEGKEGDEGEEEEDEGGEEEEEGEIAISENEDLKEGKRNMVTDPGGINKCGICKMETEHDETAMVACGGCGRWYHYMCAAFLDNEASRESDWYCQSCTSSLFSNQQIAAFPATKNGPDWWTYLPCFPFSVQIKRLNERVGLKGYLHALKSLHPEHFWCAGTNDSKKLRKKWTAHWRENPLMFFRYVRVLSFSG